ncbi:MAG: TonB-dependent receptor [Acinetobacter sp.]
MITYRHIPFSVKLLTVVVLATLYQTSEAAADVTQTNEDVKSLDTIVVTGTRSFKRSATESLQPIDVISAENLVQRTGSTELATALSRIIPSINFPRPTVVDGTELVRPAQLKGLSPDHVLVLVNGKRRHTGAFVNLGGTIGRGSSPTDLNAIPISAISRIEVLREGAAARYGSDAIAGVINIILKSNPTHGEAGIKYGGYKAGDGEQKQSYISGGTHLGENGFAVFSGEWSDSGYTNRAGYDFRDSSSTTYGQRTFRIGDPKTDEIKVALNAGYDFNDAVQVYGFTTYSRRNAETAAFYRLSNSSSNVTALFPNGYLPIIEAQIDDFSVVGGIKGQLGEWKYDTSIDYGLNKYDFGTRTINVDLYNDTGSTPFSFHNGVLQNSQTVVNLDLSRDIENSFLASPLSVAFGAQYINQVYTIKAGDPDSYYGSGSVGLAGIRAADAGSWSRDSYAGYIDIEGDITQKLTASAAYRHEYYNDFGNTDNVSLSLRYAFKPSFAVRGTVSTGFRAPSLAQQYYTQTSSQLVNGSIVEAGTFPASSQVAKLLGAEDLKPEKSKNYTVGFVFKPNDQFYLTVDAYLIDIKDRISLSSNISATSQTVKDYLAANGITDTSFSTVRYFNNAADTRTIGVDVVASYQWKPFKYGELSTSLAYNFNRNKVTHVDGNPAILNALGINLTRLDRREQYGLLAGSTPEHKLSLSNDWKFGNFLLNTNLTRYGSYISIQNVNTSGLLDQKFSAKWLLDLALSYQLKNWTFTVGSDNVTDEYPDKSYYVNSTSGNFLYGQYSPFGFNGAYYYGKIAYRW